MAEGLLTSFLLQKGVSLSSWKGVLMQEWAPLGIFWSLGHHLQKVSWFLSVLLAASPATQTAKALCCQENKAGCCGFGAAECFQCREAGGGNPFGVLSGCRGLLCSQVCLVAAKSMPVSCASRAVPAAGGMETAQSSSGRERGWGKVRSRRRDGGQVGREMGRAGCERGLGSPVFVFWCSQWTKAFLAFRSYSFCS